MINEHLKIAIKASLEAGDIIMKIYDTPFDVELKNDKSPLTEADKQANDIINSYLKPTKIPIISEENRQTDFLTRKNWETCWIVDPVDGTKEFIKRNGEFTVNIALVTNQKPVLGVIYVPATKVLYVADVNEKTAFKVELKSHSTTIDEILDLARPLKPQSLNDKVVRVVGSRSHMSPETLIFIESLKSSGKEIEIIIKTRRIIFGLV